MTSRPLRRSRADRILGGVLGGVARYYDWDPVAVRIGYVAVSILSAGFPGVLVYIVAWIIIPEE
jgi:phage shock protein PspC (stress-responsive transcriptional regulator)